MEQRIDKHVLKNGMVILGEPMEGVESVAFYFLVPAGASRMPDKSCGVSNILEDWILRGAGDKDNRQLNDAIDGFGVIRNNSVGSSFISIGGSLESSNISKVIDLYADIINKPLLNDEEFEFSRQLAIDEVLSLEDDPRHKVMLKLREHFYPEPLGRSTLGEIEDLKQLTSEKTKHIFTEKFNPSGMIFSIAGKYNFELVCNQMENLFARDSQKANVEEIKIKEGFNKYTHIKNSGSQVHIGLMTKTVRPMDKGYYDARVAVSVLSGGMSARLFTEVREKRGLCYAVGARYHSLKEAAGILCYAGTTPDKAQQTHDVIIEEFRNLSKGISEDEIERAKAGLKSSLIMQSESSSSRAGSIASDFYMLGNVRSLDEIKDSIERTSVNSVIDFLSDNPFKEFTVFTIGPTEINVE
ncbi:MAG: insulinase family protein [Sedimentisphaerales bacterium]|nr:insulinase family protein [Sedimentisphaerales bacterium]